MKRSICTTCHQDLNHYSDNFKCTLTEERFRADIYDIDTNRAFCQLIDRLYPEITQYKQQIVSQSMSEYNDIPFNNLYQNTIRRLANDTNFISLILHIDDVSLCKSSKLSL